MEPSEERQKTNQIAWRVNIYLLGFFLLGIIATQVLPEYKECAICGVGILFVAVSAFLVGYYRTSYPLEGRNLEPCRAIAMLMIALLPAGVAVWTGWAATGDIRYVLAQAAAILVAEMLFVVGPLMLGRRFGHRRSARI